MKYTKKTSILKRYIALASAMALVGVITAVILYKAAKPDAPSEITSVPAETTVGTSSVPLGSSAPHESTTEVSRITATEYSPPANRDTDFSGCLFIGDSRTEGLMLYSGVRGAVAYTARGLAVNTYFTSEAVELSGKRVTVADAVENGAEYSRVYIMLGLNELGWEYGSAFIEAYAKVIDHLKVCMPDAHITVQSIIPVTEKRSLKDSIYNNENIKRYNALIRELCEEKGVDYFNLVPLLCGEDYALPEDAAFDGIHLQKPYCKRWLDCLKEEMIKKK